MEESIKYLLSNVASISIATTMNKLSELNMLIFKLTSDVKWELHKDTFTFENGSKLKIIIVDNIW